MMRLQADEDLLGHLRGHCGRPGPQRLRLLRSVHGRGFVVTAREDRPSGSDGRSDRITHGPRVLLLARLPQRVSSRLRLFVPPYTSALSDSALI